MEKYLLFVSCRILSACFAFWLIVGSCHPVFGQPPQCDPSKVVSADSCAKCHSGAVQTWQSTPHFQTFEQLHRNPRAKEIASNMGLRSIKRGNVCISCHYTTKEIDGKLKVVSGVSCESCHGAASDWINLHNNYGGPTATKESESEEHRQQRIAESIQNGMRNPRNLYLVAQSCFQCHTVPNEELVNVGSHHAGSQDFELVAWSQGMVRHNFLRSNGQFNAENTRERLRVMFVVGMIADLEYSTRATALATEKGTYGIVSANRAAKVALQLYELQQLLNDPHVERILQAFAAAELKTNNREQLTGIAEQIRKSGIQFAEQNDGSRLSAVDPMLPKPEQYK